MELWDDDAVGEEEKVTVNKKFAKSFEERERLKELQNSKYLLEGDDEEDESDSESEDDNAELLSPELDLQIVRTINSIRKKDPSIYDPKAKWFQHDQEDDGSEDDEDDDEEEEKHKKKKYKDVLREQLLTQGAGSDDDSDTATGHNPRSSVSATKKTGLAYDREQEEIRKAFLKTIEDQEESSDEDEKEEGGTNILTLKSARQPRQKTEAELAEALREMERLTAAKDAQEKQNEAFLLDYISNKKWVDDTVSVGSVSSDEIEREEEELDREDAFESKYNFRFEELQDGLSGVQVMGHARHVEGSVRRVDEKRKQQRESRDERKARERRQKEEEIKRLKNLKKQEV